MTSRINTLQTLIACAATAFCGAVFLGMTSPAQAEIVSYPSSLVSYWNFDESASGTGTVFDQIGNNDGTFTSNVTRTTGLLGTGAALFTGTNPTGVNVGNGGGDFTTTTGIAVEALVTASNWAGTSNNEIFRKEDGGSRILFSLQTGDIISFGLDSGLGYVEMDVVLDGVGDKLTIGEFTTGTHHVVASYDSTSGVKALYIDGLLQQSVVEAAGININSGGGANAFIGSFNGSSEAWTDVIDEVAFYNSALSESEILLHFENVQAGQNYFVVPVPEPSSFALITLGLVAMRRVNRRRQGQRS